MKGHCYCNQVSYEVHAPLQQAGICHCRDCQRLTGGCAWPFIVVPTDSLQIFGDISYFCRKGASGQQVKIGFCANCGTTLLGKPEVWPSITTLSASTLVDPSVFKPNMHLWYAEAQTWLKEGGSKLVRFDANPVK